MSSLIDSITRSRVWRSFFRHGWPDNPLDRSLVMTTNVFFHLHPVKVSRKSLKATYSWGLGVLTAVVFLELGQTKTDYVNIFFDSNDFYEGQVRLMFNRFLFREPTSAETAFYADIYKANGNFTELQSAVFSMDEYAGIQ